MAASNKPLPSVLKGRNLGNIIIPIQEKRTISHGRPAAGGVACGGFAPAKALSRIIFDKYDTDHNGAIDPDEFMAMVLELGYLLTPEQQKWAVSVIDESGNGRIEYDEFISWWKKDERVRDLQLDDNEVLFRAEASLIFRQFDNDLNGFIDKDEFPAFYSALLERQFTSLPHERCLADIDSSGDGHIQFNEFIRWLQRNKTEKMKTLLTDFLQSDDSEATPRLPAGKGNAPADAASPAPVLATADSHQEEKVVVHVEARQALAVAIAAHVEETAAEEKKHADGSHHHADENKKGSVAVAASSVLAEEKKSDVAGALGAGSLTYAEIKAKKGQLDVARLEIYLNDAEFRKVFGISREEFNKRPAWKRSLMKKDAGLF